MMNCALTTQPETTLFSDDEDDVEGSSVSPSEHSSEDEDELATKYDTTNDVSTMPPRSDAVENANLERAVAQSLLEKDISNNALIIDTHLETYSLLSKEKPLLDQPDVEEDTATKYGRID